MKLRCATCGYSAVDPDFFRRERGGVLRRKQTVCDACSPYQPSRRERWVTLSFWIWQPIWLIALFAFSRDVPGQAFGIAVLFVCAVLCVPLAIAVHEAGHAVAAAAVGRRVVEVGVGNGPAIAKLRIAGVDVKLGRYLWWGGVMRSFADVDTRSRWRDAVVFAAGPCANAVVALPAFLAAERLGGGESLLAHASLGLLLAIALVNAGFGALNLLPFNVSGVGASDGQRILNLAKRDTTLAADSRQLWRMIALSELGRFARVEAECSASARTSHFGPLLVSMTMNAVSKLRGPDASIAWYLAEGFDPDTMSPFSQADTAMSRAWLKASVAWDALMTGRPELRELADTLSRQAFEASPQISAVKGTRGVVLGAYGVEGFDMLLDAARAAVSNEEKADFCGALAAGLRKRGEDQRADGFDAVSARFREKMAAQYR